MKKLKTLIEFVDIETNVTHFIGDVFSCSDARAKELLKDSRNLVSEVKANANARKRKIDA